jgi:hypothetical protein
MEAAEAKALDLAVLRLHRRFPERPMADIRDEVTRVHHDYDGSRIRGFVPILVEREVAEGFEHHPVAS